MISINGAELYQWDVGRSVEITTTGATHVHFANVGDSQAPIFKLANGQAPIPDYLFQTGKQLCVYAVKDGVTIESRIFSVKKRERPENYVYDEDQRNYIYDLINSAEDATKAANDVANELREAKENGEFNGPPGPQGEPGPAGPAGAGRLDVTRNGNKASHNAIEIYEHTEKGGQVFFDGMQLYYSIPHTQYGEAQAVFRYSVMLSELYHITSAYVIFEDGSIDEVTFTIPYLDDDAVHHTSTWSSWKISEQLDKLSALNVTIDGNKASHTPSEILEHINNGGSVYCNGYELNYVDEYQAVFEDNFYSGHEGSDGKPYAYCMTRTVINEGGTVTESLKNVPTLNDGETTEYNTWSSQKIAEEIAKGGGGIFTFRINCGDGFDYNYIYSDKSLSEIKKSVQDKKFVLAVVFDETPANIVSASVYLDSFEGEEGTVYVTTGSIPNSEFTYVYKGDVATNTWTVQKISGGLGDVEAALDAIIKIQNSLIGGGSV